MNFLRIFILLSLPIFIPSLSDADITVRRLSPRETMLMPFTAAKKNSGPESSSAIVSKLQTQNGQIVLSVYASFPPAETVTTDVMIRGKMSPRNLIHLLGGAVEESPAGAPEIPYIEYFILLPKGYSLHDAHLDFYQTHKKELPQGLNFIPQTISFIDLENPQLKRQWESSLQEDDKIYSKPALYPDINYSFEEQIHLGYRLLRLRIKPFKYQPLAKELLSFALAKGYIRLLPDVPAKRIPDIYIRTKEKDQTLIKRMVVNGEEIATYIVATKPGGTTP